MSETPTTKLTKKDRRRAAIRYNFMACNIFNYESQMGPAVAWALAPALRKFMQMMMTIKLLWKTTLITSIQLR